MTTALSPTTAHKPERITDDSSALPVQVAGFADEGPDEAVDDPARERGLVVSRTAWHEPADVNIDGDECQSSLTEAIRLEWDLQCLLAQIDVAVTRPNLADFLSLSRDLEARQDSILTCLSSMADSADVLIIEHWRSRFNQLREQLDRSTKRLVLAVAVWLRERPGARGSWLHVLVRERPDLDNSFDSFPRLDLGPLALWLGSDLDNRQLLTILQPFLSNLDHQVPSCIILDGASGAGKTHTAFGGNAGLVQSVALALAASEPTGDGFCQALEVIQDEFRDLLAPSTGESVIKRGMSPWGLATRKDLLPLSSWLPIVQRNRTRDSTHLNPESTRGHLVLRLSSYPRLKEPHRAADSSQDQTPTTLTIVDLAGDEPHERGVVVPDSVEHGHEAHRQAVHRDANQGRLALKGALMAKMGGGFVNHRGSKVGLSAPHLI